MLLLLAGPVVAATTATVTPGDWSLYRGTSIVSRHATEAACVDAAKTLNVARSYTCRTSTGVVVAVTVDPPPAPVDCAVSDWSAYSYTAWAVSGAVETRTGTRTRTVVTPAANGGAACPALSEVITESRPYTPPIPSGNPCDGLPALTTKALPMASSARPAKGVWVTDPKTGARVMRITDQAQGKIVIPAYSTIPAWNADESLIVLYVQGKGHILLDGKTYAFKKDLDINPADVEQFYWSSTDPDVLFYADNREASGASVRQLIRYHISTGAKDVVKDWSAEFGAKQGYNAVRSGNDPLYTSTDNTKFGQGGRLNKNGPGGASLFDGFIYDLTAGQRSVLKQVEGVVPQPTPSGRWAFLPGSKSISVLDPKTLAVARTVAVSGEDVWASIQFDGPSGSGTLITGNLDTGEVKTIIGEKNGFGYPPSGTHISGRAIKRPGWVAVDVIGDSNTQLLARSVFLANIDTGQMCYAAHHHSTSGDYWAEPHVVASPSGTRLLFGSDWEGNGTQVDTYVVELPAYKGN
jgi:hypothetical protein